MKSLKKLQAKREKHRQKIIKEFGNGILKLCSVDVLKVVKRDIKSLERKYIQGSGSYEYTSSVDRYGSQLRFEDVIKYYKTLDFIEDVKVSVGSVDEKTLENSSYEITWKFVVPKEETALGDRFYKPN